MDSKDIFDSLNGLDSDAKVLLYERLKDELDPEINVKMAKIPELSSMKYNVFDDREVKNVTKKVLDIRHRRYILFVHMQSNPALTDNQLIDYIINYKPHLSYDTAARDVANVKSVVGNFDRASKELYRKQVIDMHKKAYQKAYENNNEMGMVAATNGITRAANLEKEDPDQFRWDLLNPPNFEPVHDITAVGLERKPNIEKRIKQMIKKYDADAVITNE